MLRHHFGLMLSFALALVGPSAVHAQDGSVSRPLVLFPASDGTQTQGWEPWISDGTSAGTRIVEMKPGPATYDISMAPLPGGALVGFHDGKTARLHMLSASGRLGSNIGPAGYSSTPHIETVGGFGYVGYSVLKDRRFNLDIYRTRGTKATTTKVGTIKNAYGRNFGVFAFKGKRYLHTCRPSFKAKQCFIFRDAGQLSFINEIYIREDEYLSFLSAKNYLFYQIYDEDFGWTSGRLYVTSNPAELGRRLLPRAIRWTKPYIWAPFKTGIVFSSESGFWFSDGTDSGTYQLGNIDGTDSQTERYARASLMTTADALYTLSATSLHRSGGEPGDAVQFPLTVNGKTIHVFSSEEANTEAMADGRIVFSGYEEGQYRTAIYSYDLATGQTLPLRYVGKGEEGWADMFTAVGSRVFFRASEQGQEADRNFKLWVSDGRTYGGTRKVKEIDPGDFVPLLPRK